MLFVHHGLSLSPIAIHLICSGPNLRSSKNPMTENARSDLNKRRVWTELGKTGRKRRWKLRDGSLILKDEPIGVEAIMSNFSGEMMDLSETLMTEGFNDFVFVLSFQSVVDAEANSQKVNVTEVRIN